MVRHIMLKLRVLNLRIVLPILGLPEIEHCIFHRGLDPFLLSLAILLESFKQSKCQLYIFLFSLCKILINIDFIMLEYDALAF